MNNMLKTGRNDPCPCGSGKKYKKCCMQTQESTEKTKHGLREKILRFSREPRFEAGLREAKEIFFEGREPDEGNILMFVDWFIHDYRLKDYGKSIIELFYLEKLQYLSPIEKEILEEWRNTVLGVYEVTGIEKDRGVYIKELFDNTEIFVNDIRSSKGMNKWDIATLRVIKTLGKVYISGAACLMPATAKVDTIKYGEREFIEFKKEKPEATWQEFMNERGYTFIKFAHIKAAQPPLIVTPEGDPIVFTKAVYKVKDYKKALDVLQNIPIFKILDFSPEKIHFGWLVEIREKKASEGQLEFRTSLTADEENKQYRSMGHLTINNKQLMLDCLSEKRLELGKNLLKALGDSIELQSESKEYPDLSWGKAKTVKDETQQTEIEESVREELRKKFLEDHYRKWVDMPIPFLNDMTPREASKTQEGRAKLKELIKVLENAEERRERAGQPSYDVSKLRETLGV